MKGGRHLTVIALLVASVFLSLITACGVPTYLVPDVASVYRDSYLMNVLDFTASYSAESVNPSADKVGLILLYYRGDSTNSAGTTITFTGAPVSGTTKTVELDYNGSAQFAGVNLVGNPFPVNATMDMSCYVMNSARNGIEASPVSANTAIEPFTGVFVVAESKNQSVKFTKLSQSSNGSKNNNGYVNLVLSQQVNRGNATLDKAVLSFNDGDQLGKFYFGNQDARIYIPQNGKEFAIVSSEPFGTMPVNFRTEVNGSYTLNINVEKAELNYLHLIDNMTGADVDLLVNPSYTFNATNLDYESRFTLVFSNSNTESAEGNEDFAFISNGNLVVAGTGTLQIVDMMGRVVNTFSTSDHVNTNSLANGVYVIRLVNGENVKTQKIVVK